MIENFEEMNLKEELLKGIIDSGFEKPSKIQKKAIIPIIQKKDVIIQSQSGTGKTGVFSIASLQLIDQELKKPQVLIISPIRELAEQTYKVIKGLSDYLNIIPHCCIGGKNYQKDISILENGVHIISGTPGRLFDMICRKSLETKYLKLLIIDEADIMLDKGFKAQIYEIYRYLPEIQNIIISATYTKEIIDLCDSFMTNPIKIMLHKDEISLKDIKQTYILLDEDSFKFETLIDLYESLTISQAVIFCNTIERVEWLSEHMKKINFTVCSIHGKMNQKERDIVMDQFRSGKRRVLIATDIWGRGIDVQQVSLVVNFDLPKNKEQYIHRIGRSGRYGKKGLAINLILPKEISYLKKLEYLYSITIEEMPNNIEDFL